MVVMLPINGDYGSDMDRYSRSLRCAEHPGSFDPSLPNWPHARRPAGHHSPAPSPAGSPHAGPSGSKEGGRSPSGWGGPIGSMQRPWSSTYYPGEPPHGADRPMAPAHDVHISTTFLHMMKARNLRKYGRLWSTWDSLHFWRLVFLLFFFFFAMFGSLSFTTTHSGHGSHWQIIGQIDWAWDTFSFVMFLFVAAAYLVSRRFGHGVQLFFLVYVLGTALAAWASGGSTSVPIFQNSCESAQAVFDTVTCPTSAGCRTPIRNDTDLLESGAVSATFPDRGPATPTVYNRRGPLTAGYTCAAQDTTPLAQRIVWSILIAVAVIVLLHKFCVYVVYKAAIRHQWIDLEWLYGVRRVATNAWAYRSGPRRRRVAVQYAGEVNDRGVPHGLGHWTDGDFHGEHLYGLFCEGAPVGPFTSAEQGTNCTFTNVRIGVVQCRAEGDWAAMALRPAHRELTFGIAGVTACTSGVFYKHYPVAELITPLLTRAQCEVYYSDPDAFAAPRRCAASGATDVVAGPGQRAARAANWFGVFVDQIQHLAGQDMPLSVVVAADAELGLMVEGFHPVETGPAVQISVVDAPGDARAAYSKDGGSPTEPRRDRRLVVHNWRWNADRPFEVLLFVPGFNASCKHGAGMFSQFLALGDFPPQLKPFLFSWPSGQVLTYWQARAAAESAEVARSFAELVAMLMQVGFRRFHVLAHSMGARCWFSVYEAAQRLFADADAPPEGGAAQAHLVSVCLMNAEYPLRRFAARGYRALRRKCNHITVYGNAADGALRWAQLVNDPRHCGGERSLGKAMADPALDPPMDVDVVDTTSLQNNVHKTRHSYFNINRELVEDLRDLIVTQRRAAHRIRLRRVKEAGNVYVFMVAPPALNNG